MNLCPLLTERGVEATLVSRLIQRQAQSIVKKLRRRLTTVFFTPMTAVLRYAECGLLVFQRHRVPMWMENAIEYADGSSGIEVRAATLDDICEQEGLKNIAFVK